MNEGGTNTNISITAVSDVNKAYVVENSGMAGHYGGDQVQTGCFIWKLSKPAVYLTSTTNVNVHSDDLDVFGGYSYGTRSSTFYGSVIE